jgi:SSS family transporter
VGKAAGEYLTWSGLPPLPPALEQELHSGLTGSFIGAYGDVLIIAGGATDKKEWSDSVFVMKRSADGSYRWVDGVFKLPRPLAYGVSVSTDDGVMCFGGCDSERCFSDVFMIRWNPGTESIETEKMPSLPRPLAFMASAKVGERIYIAGGKETTTNGVSTDSFWSFDLSTHQWRELPALPGSNRSLAVAASQNNGREDLFYLFGGLNTDSEGKIEILADAYCYSPDTERWKRLADIAPEGERTYSVAGATGIDSGVNHVMVFGGADRDLSYQLIRLDEQILVAEAGNPQDRVKALTDSKAEIISNSPNFGKNVLTYHTITDTWVVTERLPVAGCANTIAARFGDSFIVLGNEISDGIRAPGIWRADPAPPPAFGAVNYSVLAIYLLALVAMGLYLSRREHTTNDYFKAGNRMPWWAVGLSLFATMLSAITYMSIPALAYATDWRRLIYNLPILMVAPIVVLLFLPFFRRLNVTTAYEYLERRFNLASRMLGSALFILLQLGRLGVVVFLPSLLLSTVTGINIYLAILAMGTVSIIYTTLGGIEADIWNDVIQAVVLMGGALLCLCLIVSQVDGGIPVMVEIAQAQDKFRTFDFSFDMATDVFWVCLLGGLAANLVSYGSDQMQIQRYLTTKDERSAAKSIWANGILSIVPSSVTFFALGTALFVFYKVHPHTLNPAMNNIDAILPWYIITQLPQGASGLIVAGIFAASMSSLDSSMNSTSAVLITDFYRRFKPGVDEHTCLNIARALTVIVGVIGTTIALVTASLGPMYM